MKPPTIRPDLLGHYFMGSVVSLPGRYLALHYGVHPAFGAIGLALLAGVIKDVVWDLILKKGTFDPLDILWTAAGGIPASLE